MIRINSTAINYYDHEPVYKLCVQTINIVYMFFFTFILLTSADVVCAGERLNVPSHKSELTEKRIPPGFISDTHKIKLSLTSEEKAWLAKKHTIRVQYWQHPPYFYLKDGIVVGISVDLLNAVSVNTGITFKFENRLEPFSEVLKGLIDHNEPDVVAAIMPTSEREKVILFTEPYINSPRFIFTREDTPFVASIEQLSDAKIAVVRDYVTHKTLTKMFPDIELLVLENNEAALRAVSSGKAMAFIGDLVSTPAMINEFGLKNLKVVSPSGLPDHPLAMGIRNDWPELRSIMNKGLIAIPAADKAAIINKWSSVRFDYGISSKDIWTWIIIINIALIGIILLFSLWNRSLKKQVRERTQELKAINNSLEAEIVERKQIESSLVTSEEKYRFLVDNSLVGVFNSNLMGDLIYVNSAMVQIFDFDSIEQMQMESTLSFWADVKQRERMLIELQKYGGVSNFETQAITHTGRYIHVLFSAKLHNDLIFGMGMDISKRKQAEDKIKKNQKRLKALAFKLTMVEEKQRSILASELHDNIGQSLVFSRMQLANLKKYISQGKAQELIDELSQSILQMIRDTKELVFDLSSPLLHEIGLSAAIAQWLSEQIGQKHGIETEIIDHSQKRLQNKEMRMILFRNVRELLVNVVKHAHAKKVTVFLEDSEDNLKITIQDDGRGFVVNDREKVASSESGFGIFSVQQRMDDVSGTLHIESEPGKGTRAILTAPFTL